ncbi:uncharacterized protein SPPG_08533 [Spizellomyces punctatus DAOM BR117]|uniref:Uncharacterized protein n=1 Tax=Spizellomyces punctatus (strain DAOM BR117) TaxID=645134 RepID=A0A0L0H3U6_SPIPD|nr:uncharacterized protein SPPG_08533 [Spizellomyces punctatus DAOM BR117]KNC96145.1 hypothetical protein SPPG_08533 [Spizellomyces punctatus DAOM BR117]|eukprot:XP_016604185.1 hypothetical protein SPPG_08533 [Spizellomyces punctatus DAOM BR117]
MSSVAPPQVCKFARGGCDRLFRSYYRLLSVSILTSSARNSTSETKCGFRAENLLGVTYNGAKQNSTWTRRSPKVKHLGDDLNARESQWGAVSSRGEREKGYGSLPDDGVRFEPREIRRRLPSKKEITKPAAESPEPKDGSSHTPPTRPRRRKRLPWEGSDPIEQLDPLTVERPHLLLFSRLTDAFQSDPTRFVDWLAGLNDAAGTIYFKRGEGWPRHVWEIVLPAIEVSALYYIKMMVRYSVVRSLPDGNMVWRCYEPHGLLRMARLLQGRSWIPERQAEISRLCRELGHPELFCRPNTAPRLGDHWFTGFFEARGRLRVDTGAQAVYAEVKWHEPETLKYIQEVLGAGEVLEDSAGDKKDASWWSAPAARKSSETPKQEKLFRTRRTSSKKDRHTPAKPVTSHSAWKLRIEGRMDTALLKKHFDSAPFKGSQAIDFVKWNRTMLFLDRGYQRPTATKRGSAKLERLETSLNNRLPDVATTTGVTPHPVVLASWDGPGGESTRDREALDANGWIEQVDEESLRRTTGRTKPNVGEPGYVEPDPNEVEAPKMTKREKTTQKKAIKREGKKRRADVVLAAKESMLTGEWVDETELEGWAKVATDVPTQSNSQ